MRSVCQKEPEMNKTHLYHFLSIASAALIAFGSMAGMNGILQARQRQLLTERGRTEIESPVRVWEGWDTDGENVMNEDTGDGRAVLTVEQAEAAIENWNNREKIILHEPVSGQISMEKAIEAGKEWLIEMEIGTNPQEAASYSANAKLGVGVQRQEITKPLEAYYSFWTVQYLNEFVNAELYINALTGKVWGAEITLYGEPPEKMSYERLRIFTELAGFQISERDFFAVGSEGARVEIDIEGSNLYAEEITYDMTRIAEEVSSRYHFYSESKLSYHLYVR